MSFTLAFEEWAQEQMSDLVDGLPVPPKRHIRRRLTTGQGSIVLDEAAGNVVVVGETTGDVTFSDLIPDPEGDTSSIFVILTRSDAAHTITWSPNVEFFGADPAVLEIPVGVAQVFQILRPQPSLLKQYGIWMTRPQVPERDTIRISGTATNGALPIRWRNHRPDNVKIVGVWAGAASGTGRIGASYVGGSTIWTAQGSQPEITVSGGSAETTVVEDGVIGPGGFVEFSVENSPAGLTSLEIDVMWVVADRSDVVNSGSPVLPPPVSQFEISSATGGTIASGAMLLETATLTPADGISVGDASGLGSNLVYLALTDFGSTEVGDIRVWIDHPDPASLVAWDTSGVQGEPGFVRYDGRAPWTVSGAGNAPDECLPWDCTTDPTGSNDPSFQTDGPHTWTVQVLHGDVNNCSVVSATLNVVTTRSGASVPPDTPTGLSVVPVTNGLNIDWQDALGATSYELELTRSGGSPSISSTSVSSASPRNLAAGSSYSARVRSVDSATGLRSAWTAAVSGTPTGSGGGGGVGLVSGLSSNALRPTLTTQGAIVWTNRHRLPATVQMVNTSQSQSMRASKLTAGLQSAVNRWQEGRGTAQSIHDGPTRCLTIHMTHGVNNAKYVNNNHIRSFEVMADIANGASDAEWIKGIQQLAASTVGGVAPGYWTTHTIVRYGWEVGGQWNADFPGYDPALIGALGTATGYSSEVNDAWNHCNQTGERFPMWKLIWDRITRLSDAECERLGVGRMPFMCNLAHGNADPDANQNSSGPGSQFTPYCVTDVERTPDLVGFDYYGRGAPQPIASLGPANGNPDNYSWTWLYEDLNKVKQVCIDANRPLAFAEYGSCRRRSNSTSGTGWDDHERAAFHQEVNEWLDSGCGDNSVEIWLASIFIQKDASASGTGQEASNYNRQVNNNISYTWHTDQHPDGFTLPSAERTRETWDNWIAPQMIG